MSTAVRLRPMQPADGPALQHLMEYDPPAPGLTITTRFQVDPYTAWTTLQSDCIGVVAEATEGDSNGELIGVTTVAFDTIQYEGEKRPCAFLENVKVHHAFRGQGLSTQLIDWCLAAARERFGPDVVIASGTVDTNTTSLATMKKWGAEFINAFQVVPRPPRRKPPRLPAGITIATPHEHQLPEITRKSNRFFADYNFYSPLAAERLRTRIADPAGIFHYRVVHNAGGQIIGGAMVALRGQLMVDEVYNVPPPLRLINRVVHILPADYRIRIMEVANFWAEDVSTGRALWDHLRWEFRDRMNSANLGLDARSPLAGVLDVKPWQMPKLQIVLAVRGPVPRDANRLICNRLRG